VVVATYSLQLPNLTSYQLSYLVFLL
jgi:hypothetical protein